MQRVVQHIADDLLGHQVGERLPTTVEYQQRFGVGSGTVQRAVATLEGTGALTLTRHGHRGTKIVDMSHGALWSLTGRGQVRISVPIPGAIDAFGLSKGIRAEFDRLEIPSDLGYLAGSRARASLVASSAVDISVMSQSAADNLPPSLARATQAVRLGAGTFYAPGALVSLQRKDVDLVNSTQPVRVARDSESADHIRLTEVEFPPHRGKYVYVDCRYASVPGAVLQSLVDIGIWHQTLLPAPLVALGLIKNSLAGSVVEDVLEEVSSAILLVRKDDAPLLRLLTKMDLTRIRRVQRQLLSLDPAAPQSVEQMWSR